MKLFTTLLTLLLSYSMLGQFIPQPNEYNPDVNGDQFIGVDDVMGTLALYNSPFSNPDSLTMEFHEFPAILDSDVDGQVVIEVIATEDTDVIYATQTDGEACPDWMSNCSNCYCKQNHLNLILPEGDNWKVVQLFAKAGAQSRLSVKLLYPTPSSCISDTCYSPYTTLFSNIELINSSSRFLTMIRGHNGQWYYER